MLRILAAALFALLFIPPSGAFEPVSPGQYTPVSDSAATALTVPKGTTYAVICGEGTAHRYTWDGSTTPTASIGTQLQQNACVSIQGYNAVVAFRIISVAAGGTFTVSFGQ